MGKKVGVLWLEDKSARWGVVFGAVFWLTAVVLLGVNWNQLPEQLPWFYSQPWGEQRLVDKNWLMIIVMAFGGLLVLDTILARLVGKQEELLRRMLVWGGAATELLMVLSLIRVIMVVL